MNPGQLPQLLSCEGIIRDLLAREAGAHSLSPAEARTALEALRDLRTQAQRVQEACVAIHRQLTPDQEKALALYARPRTPDYIGARLLKQWFDVP